MICLKNVRAGQHVGSRSIGFYHRDCHQQRYLKCQDNEKLFQSGKLIHKV